MRAILVTLAFSLARERLVTEASTVPSCEACIRAVCWTTVFLELTSYMYKIQLSGGRNRLVEGPDRWRKALDHRRSNKRQHHQLLGVLFVEFSHQSMSLHDVDWCENSSMLTVRACQQHRLLVMHPNRAKSFPVATVVSIPLPRKTWDSRRGEWKYSEVTRQ